MNALADVLVLSIILGFLFFLNSIVQSAFIRQLASSDTSALPALNEGNKQTASVIFNIYNDVDNYSLITFRGAPNTIDWFRKGKNGWIHSNFYTSDRFKL